MSDHDDSALMRGVRRAVETTRRGSGRLSRPASWVRQKADHLIVQRLQEQVDKWLSSLAEPENARRLQSALAHVAQFGMELGFLADPHAAELYGLVAWLEARHGRSPVLREVGEHAAATEAKLWEALESILGDDEQHGPAAMEEAARRMHELRDVAAIDLLELLCRLAALESGEELPAESVEALVAFYEEADLPEEFSALAAMAAGLPGAFEAVPEPKESSRFARLRGKKRREDAGEKKGEERGLERFVPSFDDPHLRFLTLSHLFFLQSYLTRNLVEALPELLAEARRGDE